MAKKFNHKRYCASHEKVDGYTSKVCILKGQDPEPVLTFARVMVKLARAFHIEIAKPGGAIKRNSNPHNACGGHFKHYIAGNVCYGGSGQWSQDEALAFCRDLELSVKNAPTEKWRHYWSITASNNSMRVIDYGAENA